MRARPSGVGKDVLEEPRRACPVRVGAGPENAALGVNPLPSDACVVGHPSRGGTPQLLEDSVRVRIKPHTFFYFAEPGGKLGNHRQIRPYPRRWLPKGAPSKNAALQIGHSAIFFGPLGYRQNNIRYDSCLTEDKVADHKQIKTLKPSCDVVRMRCGNHRVGAEDK